MGFLWECYGISMAFAIRSIDRSLFTHLLDLYSARYSLRKWIYYRFSRSLIVHLLDPRVQRR